MSGIVKHLPGLNEEIMSWLSLTGFIGYEAALAAGGICDIVDDLDLRHEAELLPEALPHELPVFFAKTVRRDDAKQNGIRSDFYDLVAKDVVAHAPQQHLELHIIEAPRPDGQEAARAAVNEYSPRRNSACALPWRDHALVAGIITDNRHHVVVKIRYHDPSGFSLRQRPIGLVEYLHDERLLMNMPAGVILAVNGNAAHLFESVAVVRLRSKNFANVVALGSCQHFPVRDHVRDVRPLFRRKPVREASEFHEDRGMRVQKIGGELLEPD